MQAFSELFFNEFMADKFGILVKNDILTEYITEPFSRCEQFQQFGGMTVPSWDTALQAAPCAISVLLTCLFSVTYSHASTPCRPPRRQVYIVLNIQKILTFPRIRTSFFQIKVGTLLHGTLRPFGSEPTTPLTKDTSATLAIQ